ncbi:MAG: DUF4390 domain-containing protein [Spirochaetaceae bacterium]|nr:DUF4390 domain-containing protein [Spirochaetaceae bacterium]MCF7952318.1 DUF4390 domain-containing protein [Spirochaetaceae bacterium]
MKKSKVCKAALVVLIFSLQPALLFSLEIEHRIYQQDNQITLVLQLNDFPVDKVQKVFRTGQTSQIQFEVRLFNKSEGVWGFLGDQLLEEQNIIYNGRFDPFSNMYRLETTTENNITKTREYLEVTRFFNAFRSVRISFPSPSPRSSTAYLRLRVKFAPRLLMPPLNVLEPFLLDHQITTGWTQVPIPKAGK